MSAMNGPVAKALKDALMVEIKGHQLYSHAATQAKDPAAKSFFEMLAAEEETHVQMLQAQLGKLSDQGALDLTDVAPAEVDHGSQDIITDSFKKSISRGDFEMAVIGIGCDLEMKAIAYYRKHAESTEDADLKKLFTWLTEWEEGHLDQLREIETLYQDAYWADQGFSPM